MTEEVAETVEPVSQSPIVTIIDSLTDNMISILVFATACFLWATLAPVPDILQNLILVIAGFYYGKK